MALPPWWHLAVAAACSLFYSGCLFDPDLNHVPDCHIKCGDGICPPAMTCTGAGFCVHPGSEESCRNSQSIAASLPGSLEVYRCRGLELELEDGDLEWRLLESREGIRIEKGRTLVISPDEKRLTSESIQLASREDDRGDWKPHQIALSVLECASASDKTLPEACLEQAYNVRLEVDDGKGPFVWSALELPDWLELKEDRLQGTPPMPGTYDLRLVVEDRGLPTVSVASGPDGGRSYVRSEQTIALPVRHCPIIVNEHLGVLCTDEPLKGELDFGVPLRADAEEDAELTWSIARADGKPLPDELWIEEDEAILRGRVDTPQTIPLLLTASDQTGFADESQLDLVVSHCPHINPLEPPRVCVGKPLAIPLSAYGGAETRSWAYSDGPDWLDVEYSPQSQQGTLVGVPPDTSAVQFTVQVEDGVGLRQRRMQLAAEHCGGNGVEIEPKLPDACPGVKYVAQPQVHGTTAEVAWSQAAHEAPDWPSWLTLTTADGFFYLEGIPPKLEHGRAVNYGVPLHANTSQGLLTRSLSLKVRSTCRYVASGRQQTGPRRLFLGNILDPEEFLPSTYAFAEGESVGEFRIAPNGSWLAFTTEGEGLPDSLVLWDLKQDSAPVSVLPLGSGVDSMVEALEWELGAEPRLALRYREGNAVKVIHLEPGDLSSLGELFPLSTTQGLLWAGPHPCHWIGDVEFATGQSEDSLLRTASSLQCYAEEGSGQLQTPATWVRPTSGMQVWRTRDSIAFFSLDGQQPRTDLLYVGTEFDFQEERAAIPSPDLGWIAQRGPSLSADPHHMGIYALEEGPSAYLRASVQVGGEALSRCGQTLAWANGGAAMACSAMLPEAEGKLDVGLLSVNGSVVREEWLDTPDRDPRQPLTFDDTGRALAWLTNDGRVMAADLSSSQWASVQLAQRQGDSPEPVDLAWIGPSQLLYHEEGSLQLLGFPDSQPASLAERGTLKAPLACQSRFHQNPNNWCGLPDRMSRRFALSRDRLGAVWPRADGSLVQVDLSAALAGESPQATPVVTGDWSIACRLEGCSGRLEFIP